MIPVEEALRHIFTLLRPVGDEMVPIAEAAGRVLASPVAATRDQPPFPTSVMDGFAVRTGDAGPGAQLRVIGEATAGCRYPGTVGPGEAVRIFTGAPVPRGADRVVIQEDTERNGQVVTIGNRADPGPYIRPAGVDFAKGDKIDAPRVIDPATLMLAAAMNIAALPCARRPEVAILSTGDELVMPGTEPGPDQIVASNGLGLASMIAEAGGLPRRLPIAADTREALETAFDLAAGADLIVTIGGASVGDHDLVRPVAASRGMEPIFHKVAMRPGKPLMAGRMGNVPMIGLPGNPVSALVCGIVFVLPALRVLQGFPAAPAPRLTARLAAPLPANGAREHYMRGRLTNEGLVAFDRQDSGLIGVLARADALIVRPPGDGPRATGETVSYLSLRPLR